MRLRNSRRRSVAGECLRSQQDDVTRASWWISSSRRRMKTRMNSSPNSASLAIIARKFVDRNLDELARFTHLPANHGALARDHREFAGEATRAMCDQATGSPSGHG